jgi:hypothetical protein
MFDYKTPLNERQIAILSAMRAGLYTDKGTGKTYISKAYWNGIPQYLRDALTRALMVANPAEGGAA